MEMWSYFSWYYNKILWLILHAYAADIVLLLRASLLWRESRSNVSLVWRESRSNIFSFVNV